MTRAQNTTELLSRLQPHSTEPLQAQCENILQNLENTTKKSLESCWGMSTKESFHTCQAHRPLKGFTGTIIQSLHDTATGPVTTWASGQGK